MKEFKYIMKHCSPKARLILLAAAAFYGAASILIIPRAISLCINSWQSTCWRIQFYYNRQTSLLAAATNTNFLIDVVMGLIFALCIPVIIIATKWGLEEFYAACAKSLKTKKILEVDHGKTILAVARRIRLAPVEYSATFLPNMEKVGEYTNYNGNRVSITSECITTMRNMSGCVDIHNHPNGVSVPSNRDLEFYSDHYVKRGIIVASKEVTVIEMSPNFWANKDVQELIKQQYATVLQQTENLSPKKVRAIYSNFISQLPSRYEIKSETLPFWRWYMSEAVLGVRRWYWRKRWTLSNLLKDATSCQKAQH